MTLVCCAMSDSQRFASPLRSSTTNISKSKWLHFLSETKSTQERLGVLYVSHVSVYVYTLVRRSRTNLMFKADQLFHFYGQGNSHYLTTPHKLLEENVISIVTLLAFRRQLDLCQSHKIWDKSAEINRFTISIVNLLLSFPKHGWCTSNWIWFHWPMLTELCNTDLKQQVSAKWQSSSFSDIKHLIILCTGGRVPLCPGGFCIGA